MLLIAPNTADLLTHILASPLRILLFDINEYDSVLFVI